MASSTWDKTKEIAGKIASAAKKLAATLGLGAVATTAIGVVGVGALGIFAISKLTSKAWEAGTARLSFKNWDSGAGSILTRNANMVEKVAPIAAVAYSQMFSVAGSSKALRTYSPGLSAIDLVNAIDTRGGLGGR